MTNQCYKIKGVWIGIFMGIGVFHPATIIGAPSIIICLLMILFNAYTETPEERCAND